MPNSPERQFAMDFEDDLSDGGDKKVQDKHKRDEKRTYRTPEGEEREIVNDPEPPSGKKDSSGWV